MHDGGDGDPAAMELRFRAAARCVLAEGADGPAPGSSSPTWRRSHSGIPRAGRCSWPTCRPATPRPATRSSCSTTPPGRWPWPSRARRSNTHGGRPPRCAVRRPSSGSSCRRSATSSAHRSPPSRATPRRCSSPTSPGTRRRPTGSCGRSPARGRGSGGWWATCSTRPPSSPASCDSSVTGATSGWSSRRPRSRLVDDGSTIRVRAARPTWRRCGATTTGWSRCSSTCSRTPSPTAASADGIDVTLRRGASRARSRSRSPITVPASRRALAGRIFEPRVRGTADGAGAGLACRSPGDRRGPRRQPGGGARRPGRVLRRHAPVRAADRRVRPTAGRVVEPG